MVTGVEMRRRSEDERRWAESVPGAVWLTCPRPDNIHDDDVWTLVGTDEGSTLPVWVKVDDTDG
jgi:hypothetical protein